MTAVQAYELRARYLRFADAEARGRSPLYEMLSRAVADDRDALAFLLTLPPPKRQPNLLLAAVRHLFGTAAGWPQFRRDLLANPGAVRAVMLRHSTQTNEPARCAVLLPVLARLPQPLALIEVGASAGLCLLPELYGYDYGRQVIPPRFGTAGGAPMLRCRADGATPLPGQVPEVTWRAGLDLNPLDPADPTEAAWLEALVWPEQTERLANLRAALDIAAAHKPVIRQGDLLGDGLAQLCAEAPKDATLVVFHTAVLAYVPLQADRDAFAGRAMARCDAWISNEAPALFPALSAQAGSSPEPGRFLLSVNARPVAWTDPHGAAIEWIGNGPGSIS